MCVLFCQSGRTHKAHRLFKDEDGEERLEKQRFWGVRVAEAALGEKPENYGVT